MSAQEVSIGSFHSLILQQMNVSHQGGLSWEKEARMMYLAMCSMASSSPD
jgi:hypothetical protein